MDGVAGEPGVAADGLILVPVVDTVLLPGTVMPLVIGRPAAAAALQEAARTEQHVAIVLEREPYAENPGLAALAAVGTEARLLRYFTGRDGSHNAIVLGVGRISLVAVVDGMPHPTVTVRRIGGTHRPQPRDRRQDPPTAATRRGDPGADRTGAAGDGGHGAHDRAGPGRSPTS